MPPLFFLFFLGLIPTKKPGTKQTYQSGTLNMFIYRSHGASKEAACWSSNPEIWSLGVASEAVLLLPCLMGVDSHSQGFKEWHYRCVTPRRVLICSEEWGIQSGSFSSSCTETGFFFERPVVIQCISEIKASPHSCLMLTDSWKNWSFHSPMLHLLCRSLSLLPHTFLSLVFFFTHKSL